jgi:hypothetical protein
VSLLLCAALPCAPALAWTTRLMEAMARDARRLLPRSLAQLIAEREKEVLEDAWRFPPALSQSLAGDLAGGRLREETLQAFDARVAEVVELFRNRQVSDGVVRMGSLLRVPADVSDPVLSAGADGYPAGVTREYYAFLEGSLDKIPVVLDDKAALKLDRRALGAYWQRLLDRSRSDSPVIRIELFRGGRVVDHRTIDYRSPVFGVGSLAYSRGVTAIAATWLAVWREVRGDATRMPVPTEVAPADDGSPPLGPDRGPPPGSRSRTVMEERP